MRGPAKTGTLWLGFLLAAAGINPAPLTRTAASLPKFQFQHISNYYHLQYTYSHKRANSISPTTINLNVGSSLPLGGFFEKVCLIKVVIQPTITIIRKSMGNPIKAKDFPSESTSSGVGWGSGPQAKCCNILINILLFAKWIVAGLLEKRLDFDVLVFELLNLVK